MPATRAPAAGSSTTPGWPSFAGVPAQDSPVQRDDEDIAVILHTWDHG
nr:hypothetical protein [Mycobacterium seoulense]